MENLKIRGRIWLETESGLKIGVGRARLLEQIHLLGSIAEAAKILNPNSAIEKKEYFSILISNCVAVEKNKR